MSIALTNLRNAIATNTLTPLQQGALTQALDAIIPTFPVPDFEGVALPPPDESDAREWIAALYAIQAEGGAIVPFVQAGVILSNTTVQLSTLVDVTLMPNAQPAVVESVGAEFSLQPQGAMVIDGITVLASNVAGRVWERGDTVVAVQSALQTAWFVDPDGGDDNNTGITALVPVKKKAEIARRWGTWAPTLDGINVVITYLTPEAAGGHDPGQFAPVMLNGATLLHTAALPATSFTGTLLVVSPLNRAGNLALRSTFAPTTGAIAANMMLVNATRGGSVAFAIRDTGGGNWLLTQPLNPPTAPLHADSVPNVAWANGDAISGYVLLAVDMARLAGVTSEFPAVGFSHGCNQLRLIDPAGFGAENEIEIEGSGYPCFNFCSCERSPAYSGHELFAGISFGSNWPETGSWSGTAGASLPFLHAAGRINAQDMRSISLSTDCVMTGLNIMQDGTVATCYVDTAGGLESRGTTLLGPGPQTLYGPGQLNVTGGRFDYQAPAVTTLPIAIKQLNGTGAGYSNATVAGLTTVHGGIALTAANLDAAAGAAGFGGYAYGGGATIVNRGAQP
jgi:hypothetical protein